MTIFHCSIDIANGVIRYAKSPRRLDGLFKGAATGRSLPGEEVLQLAREMADKGFTVMPIGCDHFDSQGYCLGHEDPP